MWTAALGEHVTQLCDAGPTQVRVVLADQRSLLVTLKTGEQAPAPAKASTCKAIPSNKDHGDDADRITCSNRTIITSSGTTKVPNPCRTRAPIDLDSLDGIAVNEMLVVDGGYVLSGRHKPGTAYPVVALLKGRTIAWKSDVPDGNPLLAEGSASVIRSGNRIFASYEAGRNKPFVTAFAIDTGHRDWVVPFPYDRVPLLSASHDTVFGFAEIPDALVGFAPANGATMFSFGR